MIIEDVIDFLSKTPPFLFLDREALKSVAESLTMEFYPRGTLILKQDGPPSTHLRIIKKGAVKVSMNSPDGTEMVIDYRGEGDNFGFLSLVGQDRVRSNITAVEDTICYLLPKENFLRYLDSHLPFTEYFLKSHINKYIDRTFREIQNKSLFAEGSGRVLYSTRLGDVVNRKVVTAPRGTTAREAARLMTENRTTALIIADGDTSPAGILTDSDLRRKVVAQGRSLDVPVEDIMAGPVITMDADDLGYDAIIRMLRHNIHHIVVMQEGRMLSVVTNHDLMVLQGSSPLSLLRAIDAQETVQGLKPVTGRMNKVVGLLLKEGAKAGTITRMISEMNDRLMGRILEIAERRLGPPPLPFCWIVYGSEGRKEQTFKTDQDNALIYADPPTPARQREAEDYFAAFTRFADESLTECCFPPCPAGYMASNPRWCQPLRTWRRYFSEWVTTPTPENILYALTFFDFRPVHGDDSLAAALRTHLASLVKDNRIFLGHLANMAVKNQPPLGFLKSFVVEKDGEHKDELNLKVKGTVPVVDVVRLFSLEKGISETSTLERIKALRPLHGAVSENADELEYAFELFLLMRIHHQYEQIVAGRTADNFINPKQLSNLEKKSLKDAFSVISRIQDLLIELYKPMIV